MGATPIGQMDAAYSEGVCAAGKHLSVYSKWRTTLFLERDIISPNLPDSRTARALHSTHSQQERTRCSGPRQVAPPNRAAERAERQTWIVQDLIWLWPGSIQGWHGTLPVAGFIPVFTETYRLITLCSEQLGSWQETNGTFMRLTEKSFMMWLQKCGLCQGHHNGWV